MATAASSYSMDAATIYMSTSHKADGRRRGQGVRVFANTGAKYDGAWDNDLMHGYGVFIKATEAVADRGIYTGIILLVLLLVLYMYVNIELIRLLTLPNMRITYTQGCFGMVQSTGRAQRYERYKYKYSNNILLISLHLLLLM